MMRDDTIMKDRENCFNVAIFFVFHWHNAANHRRQKAERSGAFWRPSEFALLE